MNPTAPIARALTIQDLPNELLCPILACSSLKQDLGSAQLVCHQWHAVIDETIGREVTLPWLKSTSDDSQKKDNLVIGKIGVRTCFVQLDFHVEMEHFTDQLSTFKYPHLLRRLYLQGPVFPALFHKLIFGVRYLSLLEFDSWTLNFLSEDDVKNLQLPNLKCLSIRRSPRPINCICDPGPCDYIRTYELSPEFWSLVSSNFVALLEENLFPRLTQLDVRFSTGLIPDFCRFQAIVVFLKKHVNLERISIMVEYPIWCDNFFDELLEQAPNQPGQPFHDLLKLQHVDIQLRPFNCHHHHHNIWLEILQQQTTLQDLTLRMGNVPPQILEEICTNNGTTLEKIFLYKLNESIESIEGDPLEVTLDCRVFKQVVHLNTLYALGSCIVKNVKDLPVSLTSISITGAIREGGAARILLNLPNLNFINLKNVFNHRSGCGITLSLLHQFTRTRRVKRLVLIGSSLNEPFPPEGIHNGNPNSEVILTQFDDGANTIDWELSSRTGYYINKHDTD